MAFWIGSNGKLLVTDNGANIVFDPAAAPPAPPDFIKKILEIRSLIDDPVGAATAGLSWASPLPSVPAEGTVWTAGDGIYFRISGGVRAALPVLLSDAVVLACGSAPAALTRIIASINPRDYIVSFSTGGQSTAYPSFAEFRQHFIDLKAAIEAAVPGSGAARFSPHRVLVGGEW